MFPGPGASIIRNEAGEPLGWDYPSTDPDDNYDEMEEAYERRYWALKCDECGNHPEDCECNEEEQPDGNET